MIIDLDEEEIEFLIRMCHRAKRLHEILKEKNNLSLRESDMDKIVCLLDKFKGQSNDH